MARKRILCTEDDPDSRDMIALLLRNNGFEVRCATNGNEALELAKTEHFDLLLLDNWMPGFSGVEVTRALRKFQLTTPIVFYSGAASDGDERAALEAGAQIYLKKPIGIESLIDEIRKLIPE